MMRHRLTYSDVATLATADDLSERGAYNAFLDGLALGLFADELRVNVEYLQAELLGERPEVLDTTRGLVALLVAAKAGRS